MRYWLVKTEPEAFSWEDHVREGTSMWNGVRNFKARNNLREMEVGDAVLFYYSGKDRAIVGLSKVVRMHYPDPTATEGDWSVVDLKPERLFAKPVNLDLIKTQPLLADMELLRLSRLSVQSVRPEEYDLILALAGEGQDG